MNNSNKRSSKLQISTVEHLIRSNPYDRIKSEEQDPLLMSIQQTIANIDKLVVSCDQLGGNLSVSVQKLKHVTEELLTMVKPTEPQSPVHPLPEVKMYSEQTNPAVKTINNRTKPWGYQPPPSATKTRKP